MNIQFIARRGEYVLWGRSAAGYEYQITRGSDFQLVGNYSMPVEQALQVLQSL